MAQGIRSNGPCDVAGCERDARTRGWCLYHYMRWYRHGDPLAPNLRLPKKHPDRSLCVVEACGEPKFANGLCRRHEHTRWRNGSPTALRYEWADPSPCRVCGDPPGGRFRQFCSHACWNAWRNYEGDVPVRRSCVSCGETIEFLGRTAKGVRTFRARSYCPPCRRRYKSSYLSVTALAARDGAFCGLCGCDVDMESTRPDVMCPSVDHILPRSRGGKDNPENLQLAHLLCNIRKGNRTTPLTQEVVTSP